MTRVCAEFAIAYAVMIVLTIVVTFALEEMFGRDLGTGANFLPVIIAALITGQRYAKREGARPPSGFAWRASFAMSLIAFAASAALVGIFVIVLGSEFTNVISEMFSVVSPMALIVVLAVMFVIQALAIRLFFGMGAKQVAKLAEKELVDRF